MPGVRTNAGGAPARRLPGPVPRHAEPPAEARRARRAGPGRPTGDRGARAAAGGVAVKTTDVLKLLRIRGPPGRRDRAAHRDPGAQVSAWRQAFGRESAALNLILD